MTNFGYIPIYALRFMIAYFIVTNAAAMILFPGGTLFNPDLNYALSLTYLYQIYLERIRKLM